MAESKNEVDIDALIEKFKSFGKDGKMYGSNCNKLVDDCLKKTYGPGMKTSSDITFKKMVPKGAQYFDINKGNVELYCKMMGAEAARNNKKGKKEVTDAEHTAIIMQCITEGTKKVKVVQQSATGNVSGLTDTSKYTGAHKERFDASGKGKGIDGRVEKADNSGYVGNYKGEGTFGKK